MGKDDCIEILSRGAVHWNQWRTDNPEIRPDLSDTKLTSVLNSFSWTAETPLDLRNADLRGADLAECFAPHTMFDAADLSGAFMENGYLNHCSFVDARILNRAQAEGAEFVNSNFSGALLEDTNLRFADMRDARLTGARLTGCDLIYTNLTDVDIDGCSMSACKVYGAAAWNMTGTPARQQGLVITKDDEPAIEVDDIRVAQFVHLLLVHARVRDVFNAVTERGVLILGRFNEGGLEVLRAVADLLRREQYLPIIFDFERPRDRSYTETVKTLAGLSRFVIVDLSGSSVPQELQASVPNFRIPFIPILEEGREPYSMFTDLMESEWVIKPILRFSGTDDLIAKLPDQRLREAERRVADRQNRLHDLLHG